MGSHGACWSSCTQGPRQIPRPAPSWHCSTSALCDVPAAATKRWDTVLLLWFTASPITRAVKRDDSAVVLQQQFGFYMCKWCYLHSWLHFRCYKLCLCPVKQEEIVEILLGIWHAPRSELPWRETTCYPLHESAEGLLGPLSWWEQVAQLELGEHPSVPGKQADVLAWPPLPLPTSPMASASFPALVRGCSLCMTAFQELHRCCEGFPQVTHMLSLPRKGSETSQGRLPF